MSDAQECEQDDVIRSQVGNARQLALQYKKNYPWSDLPALEVSIRVRGAAASGTAAFARCLSAFGLRTPSRYMIFLSLHFAGSGRLAHYQLSRQLNLSSPTISYLIDSTEKDGLVTRTINPENRRETYVQLTEQGSELCSRLIPAVARFSSEILADFSEAELLMFNEFLTRFQQRAETLYVKDE